MMTQGAWKLGDPCFIADSDFTPGAMRLRVMPARVVCIAGIYNLSAMAQSRNPESKAKLGHYAGCTEGEPFPTRWAALRRVWRQMRRNRISLFKPVLFEGEMPKINLPPDVPKLGQVAYRIDTEKREILEVQIGYMRYEYGHLRVAYDPSPRNPETSFILLDEWWPTQTAAEIQAFRKFGKWCAVVRKEEVARRADSAIEQIFSTAEERLASPEFQASLHTFLQSHSKQPV